MNEQTIIDVVIPAYRPGAEFRELLKRLSRQTRPVRRIIVMNTRTETDVQALLADCPLPVYGTFLEGDDVFRAGCAAEGVIVIGNEANGISAAVARVVGRRLTIPRFAGAQGPESLNAAIAAAIVTAQLCAGGRGGENTGK